MIFFVLLAGQTSLKVAVHGRNRDTKLVLILCFVCNLYPDCMAVMMTIWMFAF